MSTLGGVHMMRRFITDKLRGRTRARLFYGWWIVASGFTIQMLSGLLFYHSFGAYFVVLEETFGWSRTMLSGAFSMSRMESGILGPFQGWLIDRFGPRAVVRVGLVIFAGGLMLFSQINSAWQYYVAFLVMALGSSLGGFMAVSATIVNWFRRKRSRALGITAMGMGVGGLSVPIIAWLLDQYGWREISFASGLVILVVGLAAAQLMRRAPEEYGLAPDGTPPLSTITEIKLSEPSGGVMVEEVSFTTREALRTKTFWLLSVAHAGGLMVVSAISVHLIPHVVDRLGYSVAMAGTMVSLLMGMAIVGQLFGGAIGDRIDKRIGLTVCLLGHAVALTILAFSSNVWHIALFAVIQGLSYGSRNPLVMAIRADYFGRASFATIMGFSSLIVMIGMTGGPILAGTLADRYGNYQLAFLIIAIISLLSAGLLFFWVRKPTLPGRVGDTNPKSA